LSYPVGKIHLLYTEHHKIIYTIRIRKK